ncbi:MULE transposase domain-containing protein [Phytophthora infestans]|uniref:MULE transposase domain-containing protein n=1 Tax=Phytophthora infestans TaxID=4787 RepID=A0A8S9UW27_PHYIN|nr:MULE transposase domain-containing protein [Phytophthora infestans]
MEKKQLTGKWKQLGTHTELFEWAASRLCTTKDEFDAVGERELVVLQVFESKEVNKTKEASFGMVLSCKKLLRNFLTAAAYGDLVSISCDGTYRLTDAGWTLINLGVVGVIYDEKECQFHQRFYPCAFGFVRTECELAYEALFKSVNRCVYNCLGMELKPTVGAADHAVCIAAALGKAWPEMVFVTCWPHLMTKWRNKGEARYADWFTDTYLTAPFDSWFVGASTLPGSLPQQQGIESFHKSIKAHMGLYLRAAMVYFLEFSMGQILHLCCAHRAPEEIRPFAEAPLLHSQLTKAKAITLDTTKFYVVQTQCLQTFYINRKDHFDQRAQDQSLYRVRVSAKIKFEKLRALPKVNSDTAQLFRKKYSCECKAYVMSGWVCSHVLAAAAIKQHLNIGEIQAGIPHRRRPGRPRKELSCLVRDSLEAAEGDDTRSTGPTARLKRHLEKYPSEAIGYKALHRFKTSLPESPKEFQISCFSGVVTSVQADNKPVTWTITFTDADSHDVEVDELVTDITMTTSRHI